MKRYALLLLLAIGLSACTVRFDIGVEVNEDESGSLVMFMGLDQELRDLMEQTGGEDVSMIDQLTTDIPEGFEVVEHSEDGFDGALISTTFSSLDDLNTKMTEMGDGEGSPADMVGGFGLTHEGDEFRFTADASGMNEGLSGSLGEAGGEDMLSGLDASLMSDLFDIRFQLTLPGEITEHNGDSIDGNTVTWNLDLGEELGELYAVSNTSGGSSMLLIGGAAVVAIAAAGIGVGMSRRKKQSAVDAVTGAPAADDFGSSGPVS